MAGFQIVDTYKAYKAREKKVTTWLKETASKFGFKGAAQKSSQSQPIRIREIPEAVKLIVSNGEAKPDRTGDGDTGGGYAHYLSVLEEALESLNVNNNSSATGSSIREPAPGHSKNDVEFNKLFDLLQIEDAGLPTEISDEGDGDSEKDAPRSSKPRKIKSGKRKGKPTKPRKDQQAVTRKNRDDGFDWLPIDTEDEEDELYFMIYCFFKDFNYTREYLQERWCDYQEGLLGLSAVSVATNTPIELLQRSEAELLSQIPVRSGLRNYQAMADLLFFEQGLAHVDYDEKAAIFEGDENGMKNSIEEQASFICLPTYWVLEDWLRWCPPKMVPTIGDLLGTTPDYNPEDSHARLRRDKHILTEILQECCLIKAFQTNPKFILPVEDELTKGLIEMLATRKIPIWLVLAKPNVL